MTDFPLFQNKTQLVKCLCFYNNLHSLLAMVWAPGSTPTPEGGRLGAP